ncbi:MAG: tryptophan synthase subunit alpha, partial [Nitratireductor sp.]
AIAAEADGVVVGTAIVNTVAATLDADGQRGADPAAAVSSLVASLKAAMIEARA